MKTPECNNRSDEIEIPHQCDPFEKAGFYRHWLKGLDFILKSADNLHMPRTGRFIASMLSEPIATLKTVQHTISGIRKSYNYNNMNPLWISKEQSQLRPILLIHGNYHNQGAWYPFGERILGEEGLGPVYTINIPSKEITSKDFDIIYQCIKKIRTQYKVHEVDPTIDVVGHSRGASVTHRLALIDLHGSEYHDWIGRIFLIGSPLPLRKRKRLSEKALDSTYEVEGCCDLLVKRRSLSPSDKKLSVHAGHLGLLYKELVYRFLIKHLRLGNKLDK